MEGASEKRTDFGEGATGVPAVSRRDFFRNDEEDDPLGRSDARAKSSESEGLLGWVMVEDVESVGTPRNWAVRSLYCFWRFCSVSWRVADALEILSAWLLVDELMKPTIYLQLLVI